MKESKVIANKRKKNKTILNKIKDFIILIVLLILLYLAYQFYQLNNFNEFVRSEANVYTSEFKRDNKIKYSKSNSYKIESNQYNDAMFYKTENVEKNQPYKVTCMVKTNEVRANEANSGIGAQISIEGTTERSNAITGTEDWQKIELIFNSKDRETLNIGFRLGGYLGEAKGEAWFSDFTLEKGTLDNDNKWNFACFIFKSTDVTINGNQVKLNVTQNDVEDISNTINRFKISCSELSQGKMEANCDIYNIDQPINRLSYDEEFGYYVAPEDIELQIKDTIEKNNYDHIFVIVRLRR